MINTPLPEVVPGDPEASMGELPEKRLPACVGCANLMLSNWIIGRHAQASAVADLLVNCGWDMVEIRPTTGVTEVDNVNALLKACWMFGRRQWDPSIVAEATAAVAELNIFPDVRRIHCSNDLQDVVQIGQK